MGRCRLFPMLNKNSIRKAIITTSDAIQRNNCSNQRRKCERGEAIFDFSGESYKMPPATTFLGRRLAAQSESRSCWHFHPKTSRFLHGFLGMFLGENASFINTCHIDQWRRDGCTSRASKPDLSPSCTLCHIQSYCSSKNTTRHQR